MERSQQLQQKAFIQQQEAEYDRALDELMQRERDEVGGGEAGWQHGGSGVVYDPAVLAENRLLWGLGVMRGFPCSLWCGAEARWGRPILAKSTPIRTPMRPHPSPYPHFTTHPPKTHPATPTLPFPPGAPAGGGTRPGATRAGAAGQGAAGAAAAGAGGPRAGGQGE